MQSSEGVKDRIGICTLREGHDAVCIVICMFTGHVRNAKEAVTGLGTCPGR